MQNKTRMFQPQNRNQQNIMGACESECVCLRSVVMNGVNSSTVLCEQQQKLYASREWAKESERESGRTREKSTK